MGREISLAYGGPISNKQSSRSVVERNNEYPANVH